jgi:hypothetical protein
MAVRECSVSLTDALGVMHSVSVYATTVMEAAALGRKELLDTGLIDDPVGAYEITVEVLTRTKHTVPIPRLEAWLHNSKTPPEASMKARLKERKA